MTGKINRRQYMALGFICLLYPLVRRMPNPAVSAAGGRAWLASLAAIPVLLLVFLLYRALDQPGKGLGEVMLDTLGPVFGRFVLALYALWFISMCAFIVRSGGERFVSTIYPGTSPGIFTAATMAACLIASMGSLRALGRSAMIFRPVLLLAMILVFAALLPKTQLTGVWQPSSKDVLPVLRAVPEVVNPLCTAVYLSFLNGRRSQPVTVRHVLPWILCSAVISMLLCLCAVGCFGAELTTKLSSTFFVLVRDVSLFGSEARIEPLVISMWVFSDFMLTTVLLQISAGLLGLIFGLSLRAEDSRFFDLSGGRWLLPLCAVIACALAFVFSPDPITIRPLAQLWVPASNTFFQLVPPLLCLAVKKLRRMH